MVDYYMIYRDLEGEKSRRTYERMEPPQSESELPQEQLIPDQAGGQPIYVRKYRKQIGNKIIHLVTYTHKELTEMQARAMLLQAARRAWGMPD